MESGQSIPGKANMECKVSKVRGQCVWKGSGETQGLGMQAVKKRKIHR